MHRAIALPLAAIMLALMLNAAAAQDAPPSDPIPTPTSTGAAPLRPDAAAPLRPDDAPPSDAVAGATAGSFAVYLPLVVRPNPLFDLYPPVNRAWEEEFIRLLNEERARRGLRTLVEHPLLTLAARRHAYDVGINQVPKGPEHCSHTGTDGTSPLDRLAWAGYPGRFGGEAIHCGTHEVYPALQWLLGSPGHRNILLNPDLVEVGVGAHPVLDQWGGYSTVIVGGAPNP